MSPTLNSPLFYARGKKDKTGTHIHTHTYTQKERHEIKLPKKKNYVFVYRNATSRNVNSLKGVSSLR